MFTWRNFFFFTLCVVCLVSVFILRVCSCVLPRELIYSNNLSISYLRKYNHFYFIFFSLFLYFCCTRFIFFSLQRMKKQWQNAVVLLVLLCHSISCSANCMLSPIENGPNIVVIFGGGGKQNRQRLKCLDICLNKLFCVYASLVHIASLLSLSLALARMHSTKQTVMKEIRRRQKKNYAMSFHSNRFVNVNEYGTNMIYAHWEKMHFTKCEHE